MATALAAPLQRKLKEMLAIPQTKAVISVLSARKDSGMTFQELQCELHPLLEADLRKVLATLQDNELVLVDAATYRPTVVYKMDPVVGFCVRNSVH